MDRIQELFNHIMSLELDQVQDFVKSLPKEDQLMLVSHTVGALNGFAQHLVQNSEETDEREKSESHRVQERNDGALDPMKSWILLDEML